MNTQPLAVIGLTDFDVTIPAEYEQRKNDALELARSIKIVDNAEQQQDAIASASLLKGLVAGMEKTRKLIKEPVLAAGRKIDDIAKIYSASIEKELSRVELLASQWQAKENKRLEAIRQEQERIAREAQESAEAERKTFLSVIASSTDETRDAIQRAADEAAERNAEAARERQQTMLAMTTPKAAGARVSTVMDFEVLDIWQLAAARPDLVTIEPKRALIKAAIAIPNSNIPGIRVFEETKVQAKASL